MKNDIQKLWSYLVERKKKNLLWVLSGPSGSGKTTLCQHLLRKKYLGLERSISYTTRPRRKGEIDGEDYFFISRSKFLELEKRGEFLEWQEVFGNFYGTSKKFVESMLAEGKDVVLSIDVKGAKEIRRQFSDRSVLIFIIPPNEEALRRRLHIRGDEGKKEMQRRLNFAKVEISYAPIYDYVIINDNLKQAVNDLEIIIKAKRLENVVRSIREIN